MILRYRNRNTLNINLSTLSFFPLAILKWGLMHGGKGFSSKDSTLTHDYANVLAISAFNSLFHYRWIFHCNQLVYCLHLVSQAKAFVMDSTRRWGLNEFWSVSFAD